jgi:hypothetical protein
MICDKRFLLLCTLLPNSTAREQFRAAIIAAGRYGRVQTCASIRELIAAARAPQREEHPLLHWRMRRRRQGDCIIAKADWGRGGRRRLAR